MVEQIDVVKVIEDAKLKDALRNNKVKVIFTKTDGTERTMLCTLKSDLLPPPPEEDPLKPKKIRAPNPDVQAVYDLESSGWRSFRWDSLKSWSVAE